MYEVINAAVTDASSGSHKPVALKACVSLNRLFDSLVSIAAVGLVLTLASATAFLGV